jgi:hypothetical protein
MFGRRVGLGVVMAVLLAISVSGVASAAVVIKDSGSHGVYYVVDYDTQPGGRCGYGPENSAGQAYVKWIWFLKPEVYARDTTPAQDHQKVKLSYMVQHRVVGSMTKWKTVATGQQTKTAWDDTRAAFTSQKVYAPSTSTEVWRGLVNLKWLHNGSVVGQVTYRIEWYSVKWTVGNPDYVYQTWCDGRAD